jgi:hypothetical protein
MMKTNHKTAALAVALLTMATATGFAADEQDDQWQFGVTVPLWAVGIDGDVTVRGVTSDVDIGFDDLKDDLEASLSLGLEARKGKYGLYAGFGYMKFEADGTSAGGARADAELEFLIVDAGGSYRFYRSEGERPLVIEGYAGIRYWATESDLKITAPGGGVLLDAGAERDLVDPIIGLRATKYLTQKLHLDFQGDIGGFGISDDTSDLTWSAAGLVSYDVASWFTASVGYKALALDAERGSGANERALDIVMHGALVSLKFKF